MSLDTTQMFANDVRNKLVISTLSRITFSSKYCLFDYSFVQKATMIQMKEWIYVLCGVLSFL